MNKLVDVKIVKQIDEDADTSFLGEYTDTPSDWAIVCAEGKYLANLRGEDEEYEIPSRGNAFRFFVPVAGDEPAGSEDYQKYGMQDYERMEGLNNQVWSFIGIYAQATIETSTGLTQKVRSGGLWGIETDSEQSYIDDVCEDEIADLRKQLKSLHVSLRGWGDMITEAKSNIEYAW